MISMKSTFFYSILAASIFGGAGVGYVAAPSDADMIRSLRQAQETAAQECRPERVMPKGPIYNSPAKSY